MSHITVSEQEERLILRAEGIGFPYAFLFLGPIFLAGSIFLVVTVMAWAGIWPLLISGLIVVVSASGIRSAWDSKDVIYSFDRTEDTLYRKGKLLCPVSEIASFHVALREGDSDSFYYLVATCGSQTIRLDGIKSPQDGCMEHATPKDYAFVRGIAERLAAYTGTAVSTVREDE
jgi:hypothetical protein